LGALGSEGGGVEPGGGAKGLREPVFCGSSLAVLLDEGAEVLEELGAKTLAEKVGAAPVGCACCG
jgi:hypothetical protein